MSNDIGRNDSCFCGSGRKYKNCHLKPFYPIEYFDCKISKFDDIKFENRIPPNVGIEVGDVKVYYSSPFPWNMEISNILQPLYSTDWDENQRWENRIKKRINKLHHKLNILKYNIESFKTFEKATENEWKRYIVANTTANKIYDDPTLIMHVESFLFQSKSCLDVFAQVIAYTFKFEISSYQDFGNGLIKILEKKYFDGTKKAKLIIEKIEENIPLIKELVTRRDEITHYSDLEGLSCFLIKQSKQNDVFVKVYYPAMPNGERVSKYMDKIWNGINKLLSDCLPILVDVAKK